MGVGLEALVEADELLVDHRVRAELLGEVVEVRRVGELALHQQEGHLRERAVRREVGDRVAAVEEHALVAVDERDARLAR